MSKYDYHCLVCGAVIDWDGEMPSTRPQCPACNELITYEVLARVKEVVDHSSDGVVQEAAGMFDDGDLDDSCLIF